MRIDSGDPNMQFGLDTARRPSPARKPVTPFTVWLSVGPEVGILGETLQSCGRVSPRRPNRLCRDQGFT